MYKLQSQDAILHSRADDIQNSVLKNLSFTGKHVCWSLILITLQTPPVAASDCSVFSIDYQITCYYRKMALLKQNDNANINSATFL